MPKCLNWFLKFIPSEIGSNFSDQVVQISTESGQITRKIIQSPFTLQPRALRPIQENARIRSTWWI